MNGKAGIYKTLIAILVIGVVGIGIYKKYKTPEENEVKVVNYEVKNEESKRGYVDSETVKEDILLAEEDAIVENETIEIDIIEKYTKEDLQIDKNLSLEELRIKYSTDWFGKRFPKFSICHIKDSEDCAPEKFINDFTDQQILSLFVAKNEDLSPYFEIYPTLVTVLCNIKNNKEDSKWYILKDIIHRKNILKKIDWTFNNNHLCLPEEIQNAKDVLFDELDKSESFLRKRILFDLSQKTRDEYWEFRKVEYKKLDKDYTEKNLKVDINLSLKELRVKYPSRWFMERFPRFEICEAEESEDCYPENFIDEFNNKQILSLFMAKYEDIPPYFLIYPTLKIVLCDIKNNKENSKWYILKDILYREDYLEKLNWFAEDIYKCIPREFPKFKNVIFEYLERHINFTQEDVFKYLSTNRQNEYRNYRKEKYPEPKKEYTKEDLKIDVQLNHNELEAKYRLDWFYEKFPQFYNCRKIDSSDCYPQNFINEFEYWQIISLLINGLYPSSPKNEIFKTILCDIKNNKEDSKWFILKDFLYKKDNLQSLDLFYKKTHKCIPINTPGFKEILFKNLDHRGSYFREKTLPELSLKLQKNYEQHRKNLK